MLQYTVWSYSFYYIYYNMLHKLRDRLRIWILKYFRKANTKLSANSKVALNIRNGEYMAIHGFNTVLLYTIHHMYNICRAGHNCNRKLQLLFKSSN